MENLLLTNARRAPESSNNSCRKGCAPLKFRCVARTSARQRHTRAYRFEQYQPNLVISVHPLMQHVPLRILHRRIRAGLCDPINFATVVTDFTTCSNLWFSKRVTKCFVPTAFCANRARCAACKVQRALRMRQCGDRDLHIVRCAVVAGSAAYACVQC
jgi:Monogalactosyldiacylglycerol (MGDG) synthase